MATPRPDVTRDWQAKKTSSRGGGRFWAHGAPGSRPSMFGLLSARIGEQAADE